MAFFVDEVQIVVSSGSGGSGKLSFRREKFNPRGGPDGGDGGRGGHVIFCQSHNAQTLLTYRYKKKFKADSGKPGGGQLQHGADGKDLVLKVPQGTVVKDHQGCILADLTDLKEVVLLKGGRGGRGNAFFKSSVNQAPQEVQKGEQGQTEALILELKLVADVGFLGFPNAGKSLLLSSVSAARPKVADYPFTTLRPHLGVVSWRGSSFVVADIPGLIEKASQGKGLGLRFLRHLERVKAFVHLIDISPMAEREAWKAYKSLNQELKKYDQRKLDSGEAGYKKLSDKKQFVALNKVDTLSHEECLELKNFFQKQGVSVDLISASTGGGVQALLDKIGETLKGSVCKKK